MRDIFIELAGCVVKMQLDKDIVISERLQPFIISSVPDNVDIVLDVRACEQLPSCGQGGYWEGLDYYIYCEEELYVFHTKEVGEGPFSLTHFHKEGNISFLYLKEYESYFVGSSGLFNKIGAEQLLLRHNRMMMHASFVKYQDKGILFTGPSGVGKSTQADLWKKTMGAEIINGDRVAIGISDGQWTAWGIPYAGTSGIYCNKSASISAIVVLGQAEENKIRTLNGIEAFRYLYPEMTIHQSDDRFVQKVVSLLSDMVATVPIYRMECLPDESSVKMLWAEKLYCNTSSEML